MGGQTKEVGSSKDTKVLNPGEQSTRGNALAGLASTANNYDNFIKQLMGGYGTSAISGIQLPASQDPSASAAQLLSMSPEMQATAANIASQGLNQYGQSAQELANITSRNAMRSTANELAAGGLLNSGAANAALLEASYAPQAQLQTNLSGLYNTSYNNAYNNLLGQGANVYNQQMANNTNLAGLGVQQSLGLANVGLGALGQQAGAYGSLADLTQQQYYTPQYQRTPGFLDYLTAGGSAALGAGTLIGALSDVHLKTDLDILDENMLIEAASIEPIKFRYNNDKPRTQRVGVLAQDIERTSMAENVVEMSDGSKIVDIGQQTLSNTALISLLSREIFKLRDEIASLRKD
ncbi:MAG TPA: tail fiber domain-containing protein [Dissulfurispiraceae bacterium]|nr:tail fiber domain-containing protein [Dissulfurispiraceae bacterium]